LTDAPEPPAPIVEWLEGNWEDPYVAVGVSEARQVANPANDDGRVAEVRFDADARRVEALQRWRGLHDRWIESERPARAAMHFFEKLYELHSRMEREAERIELILGDGILSWKRSAESGGSIFHPILLQRIQLAFDPALPEFTLVETGREVELYSALFRSLPDIEPKALARARDELVRGGFHPLGGDETSDYLRRFVVHLSPRGRFIANGAPDEEPDDPQVGRSPVLFLRNRTLGFATALERTLEDLRQRSELPPALLRIVGLDPPAEEVETPELLPGEEPESLLLSKPANPEQVSIAMRLDKAGCVLVQGPPGTGKTHTIANLIGHLLAQGQSVLVTSHTTKALRVLRDHVVEPLRPLCVSVLESDLESRNQLENAVTTIVDRLATGSPKKLEAEAEEAAARRAALFAELRHAREALLAARADEYREIAVGETHLGPAEAARKVTAEAETHAWLPVPPGATLAASVELPLLPEELAELYGANAALSIADEAELTGQLPELAELPTPYEMASIVRERNRLRELAAGQRNDWWDTAPIDASLETLDRVAEARRAAVALLDVREPWKRAAIAAGRAGGPVRESWDRLVELVGEVAAAGVHAAEARLQHAPLPAPEIAIVEQLAMVNDIVAHLEQGKELGMLALLAHGEWKRLIAAARVAEGEPRTLEHFRALRAILELRQLRADLVGRWNRQMHALGAPSAEELGPAPEEGAAPLCNEIRHHLGWQMRDWEPFERELMSIGFDFAAFFAAQAATVVRAKANEVTLTGLASDEVASGSGELERLRRAAGEPLDAALRARRRTLELGQLEARLFALHAALSSSELAKVAGQLRRAVENRDPEAYDVAFRRLGTLRELKSVAEQRRALLARLETAAPTWAAAIAARRPPHAGPELPGDAVAAWTWLKLRDELDRRNRV
jgi:hypothetical protein